MARDGAEGESAIAAAPGTSGNESAFPDAAHAIEADAGVAYKLGDGMEADRAREAPPAVSINEYPKTGYPTDPINARDAGEYANLNEDDGRTADNDRTGDPGE